MSPGSAGRWIRHWPGLLVVLGATTFLIREARADRPGFVDEPAWINAGAITLQLFADRAAPSIWEHAYRDRDLGDWGNKNPPLGKLLIGLAAACATSEAGETDRLGWRWGWTYEQNLAAGRLPSDELLRAARTASAVAASITLLLVYLAGTQLAASPKIAALGPLWLVLAPGFIGHAGLAVVDTFQLALMAFSTVACLRYARARRLRWLALGAAMGGLACAVKFNAAPALLGVGLWLLTLETGWQRRITTSCVAFVLSIGAFLVVNPYLYPAPLSRTVALIEEWSRSKSVQQTDPLLASTAVRSPVEGLALASTRGLLAHASSTDPMKSSDEGPLPLRAGHGALLASAVAALAVFLTLRRRRTDGRGEHAHPIVWALLVASIALGFPGLIVLLGAGVAASVRRDDAERTFALRLPAYQLGASWLAIGLWLPFDWPRYYLPILLFGAMLIPVAVRWLLAPGRGGIVPHPFDDPAAASAPTRILRRSQRSPHASCAPQLHPALGRANGRRKVPTSGSFAPVFFPPPLKARLLASPGSPSVCSTRSWRPSPCYRRAG